MDTHWIPRWKMAKTMSLSHVLILIVYLTIAVLDVNSKTNGIKDHRLVVISMDGFRWDYLHGRAHTPTFDFIKSKGVHATEGIQSAFITNTLPNHMSLITGLYVESHGMMDNTIFDSEMNETYISVFYDHDVVNDPDWLKTIGEPVWISHQIQNKGKTGVLMWMGGETAFRGVRPTQFFKHTYDMDEIDEMDMIIDWMTDEDDPIDLAMVYFPQPDTDGHLYCPESIEVTRKIEYLDKALGHFIQQLEEKGLLDKTDIVVTSDHGFTSTTRERLILVDDIVDSSWYKSVSFLPGSVMSIFPNEGMIDTVYDKLKASADSTGLFNVYKSRDIPERFHYKSHRRVAPILATAKIGYSFSTKEKLPLFDELKGNHGYDNQLQEMNPFFVALGPSFQEGVSVKTFHNVDVYPLICHIKGIQPAPNNGTMEIVSKLLRHYSSNQPTSSTPSCEQEHCHSEDSYNDKYSKDKQPHE